MKKLLVLLAGTAFIFVAAPGTASAECGLCGDLNGDGYVNILDVTDFIDWYFQWPPLPPNCPCAADVNCDNAVRVTPNIEDDPEIDDLEYLIEYIFENGPLPCDPDDDSELDCDPCG